MTAEQLKAIEARWAKWIDPESAPKTLGGDFLILLAEVKRLSGENKTLEHRRRFSYRQQSKTYLSVLRLKREVRRLNRMVDRACNLYADLQGSCPYDAHDFEPQGDCNETCENQYALCWRKYLESEVADKWLK